MSMQDVKLEFDGVWKKFRRGERARSLRDAVGGLGRRLARKTQGYSLSRNEFNSLKNVSFQVRAGECVGIIGPNGAGKSTMLKCASRILKPNRGAVRVKGRVSALIEVGAGFHPDLTGRENVFLNGTILGMRRKEIAQRFDQIVNFAGMSEFIDTPVKRYSSGMYARLGFSVAAFMDPDVLLVDEVLSVGDMRFARKCEQKLREIRATNTAVLFISHSMPAVRMMCDRVIVLNRGEIQFDGEVDDAIHAYHELLTQGDNVGQAHPSIRSLKVSVTDAVGTPTVFAHAGDTVNVDVHLQAAKPIWDASIGFFIRDEQDNELYCTETDRLNCDRIDLEPGGVARARFRLSSNLIPGVYSIGSLISGRTDPSQHEREELDHNPNRVQITVIGAQEARGTANLFASCEVSEEPFPVLEPAPVESL